MHAIPYTPDQQSQWDNLVAQSRNATFLHRRDYLAYLGQIEGDCSLCFYHPHSSSRLIAALPACKVGDTIVSHPFLTYGGLILSPDARLAHIEEAIAIATQYYRDRLQAKSLVYRPTPHIYHTHPTQDDLYVLHQMGATLKERKVSTALTTLSPNQLRRRELRNRKNITCSEATPAEWTDFHCILTQILLTRHNARPTHSLTQLLTLKNTFPHNIRLFVARKDGRVVAGTVIYITQTVAHLQYIAASDEGKLSGALTILIHHVYSSLLSQLPPTGGTEGGFLTPPFYLDFGTSMEPEGGELNRGLCQWKESFGGTTVLYDTYHLSLQ